MRAAKFLLSLLAWMPCASACGAEMLIARGKALWIVADQIELRNFIPEQDSWTDISVILNDPLTRRFYRSTGQESYDENDVQDLFRSGATLVVADIESKSYLVNRMIAVDLTTMQIQGLLTLSENCRRPWHFEIGYAVHPDIRGRGIGTKMVQVVTDWIIAGMPEAVVTAKKVSLENPASLAVLKKRGFIVSRRGFSNCDLSLSGGG